MHVSEGPAQTPHLLAQRSRVGIQILGGVFACRSDLIVPRAAGSLPTAQSSASLGVLRQIACRPPTVESNVPRHFSNGLALASFKQDVPHAGQQRVLGLRELGCGVVLSCIGHERFG